MISGITWSQIKYFKKDAHALFSPSKHSWINYPIDKMLDVYNNSKAAKLGTELHELAAMLIKNKVMLPKIDHTLNMYVNDAIMYDLTSEQQLYYSDVFFGTADAIGVLDGVLRIFDLKTGKTKASMDQLLIYASFFCLEYGCIPSDFNDIELRIYQNNQIESYHPEIDEIIPVMDKIMKVDEIIRKETQNNGSVFR